MFQYIQQVLTVAQSPPKRLDRVRLPGCMIMAWKNKADGLAWRREQRFANRAFVKEYLKSHPCIKCGFSDIRALDFDHIDPKEKHKNISVLLRGTASRKSIELEISKCQVLCSNCHRIKTIESKDYETRRVEDKK